MSNGKPYKKFPAEVGCITSYVVLWLIGVGMIYLVYLGIQWLL